MRPQYRRRRREEREGFVLLLTLLMIMIATGTAAFTMQTTQQEIRASGGVHQAVRAKYVAEAATVTYQSMCANGGASACTAAMMNGGDVDPNLRMTYGLPNWGGIELIYSFDEKRIVTPDTNEWPTSVLPRDSVISGGGAASPYTPSSSTLVEVWRRAPLSSQGSASGAQDNGKSRLIVTTFGALTFDPDQDLSTVNDVIGTGELRQAHQTISATRAFIDIMM